ncbi:hypothetical protein XELAEV_18005776mg [Xenopus laevis]|uniref:Uncharacterized protein n=1 Tax=Xenopus laevis TaxID=8355 RepID=A0A974I3J5_XENLA|nr:hypothetical protein XELAEV_18005776mg [Xenopus laevis]
MLFFLTLMYRSIFIAGTLIANELLFIPLGKNFLYNNLNDRGPCMWTRRQHIFLSDFIPTVPKSLC